MNMKGISESYSHFLRDEVLLFLYLSCKSYIQCLPRLTQFLQRRLYATPFHIAQNPSSSDLRRRTRIFAFIGGMTCCPNQVFAGLVSSGSIS
jgi:hypothetical protein